MILYIILVIVLLLFALAWLIDWRRKKNINYPHTPTNPNAKPGDSRNYMMGDNKYTNGGE
ncbi:hypothetical protein [Sporosarcina sp. E16_8]|uniref:hypothetical protein n=1 Tax=Sporosarcina sp. E16_8 TaxID=2789295 RepID=UPI001A919AA4|nr:hypothetical protein [Sporosarcina sp. E16_8]MBO0586062.1 hypothetical protein [Sporosarcina sp. E16_8]